jgi:hypothetical protein
MQILSLRTLVRTLSLSLLVIVGLSVVGCDSGGANGGGPDWVGNWRVIEENGESPSNPRIFSITESEIESVSDLGEVCEVERWSVDNIENGNTLTLTGQTEEALDLTLTLTIGDNGNLTAEGPGDGGIRTVFEPAEGEPRDVLTCESFE